MRIVEPDFGDDALQRDCGIRVELRERVVRTTRKRQKQRQREASIRDPAHAGILLGITRLDNQ
jgi:hypothetical protein